MKMDRENVFYYLQNNEIQKGNKSNIIVYDTLRPDKTRYVGYK